MSEHPDGGTAPPTGAAEPTTLLVRLSAEITTKGRGARRRFTQRLVENVRDAFRSEGASARVETRWTRLLVHSDHPAAADLLARIPGIASASAVEGSCPAELNSIVETGQGLFAGRVRGRRFAVRARRSGRHPFSSSDVQRELGTALNPGATVDLDHPDVEVEVEVSDRRAYLFSGRTRGLGGLPIGVEGRALCLLSGGFDSAVAASLLLKRGVELDYVFCNLAGAAYERSVVQVAKVLADRWSHGSRPRLHVLDFTDALDDLRAAAQPKFWQVVLKRQMYRAAAGVAAEVGALAIVTGESIGQVSSQTLANLAAVQGAVEIPIFRPLLGFDKTEIIQRTRVLGTYALSAAVREYCAIAPGSPVTGSSRHLVAREAAKLDDSVVTRAVASRRTLDLRELSAADITDHYLFVDQPPAGAALVDVRSDVERASWRHPEARVWEEGRSQAAMEEGRTHVLFCDAGARAAMLAEELQRAGYEAFALRGGTAALRKLAGERPTG